MYISIKSYSLVPELVSNSLVLAQNPWSPSDTLVFSILMDTIVNRCRG